MRFYILFPIRENIKRGFPKPQIRCILDKSGKGMNWLMKYWLAYFGLPILIQERIVLKFPVMARFIYNNAFYKF